MASLHLGRLQWTLDSDVINARLYTKPAGLTTTPQCGAGVTSREPCLRTEGPRRQGASSLSVL
jgi:hypothetical protein